LTAQTGHQKADWPLVVLKELMDNALDACEEARVAPEISVTVNSQGITVADNGPGLPQETIKGVMDYSVRVSSREAYMAPDWGAQGNALKTIIAMPFVLDGKEGKVIISAGGLDSIITFRVDQIRQEPHIDLDTQESSVKTGTRVKVCWPDLASSMLAEQKLRFLQIGNDYTWLNPHLTLTLGWFDSIRVTKATNPEWTKWKASDPTCPHWYDTDSLSRLIAAYLSHDMDNGRSGWLGSLSLSFVGYLAAPSKRLFWKALDWPANRYPAL
jgi:DNA topoisomerase VI subunit B